jgi:hypothetical protein
MICAPSAVVFPPGALPLRSVEVKPGVTPNISGPFVPNSLPKANVKEFTAVFDEL